MASRRFYRLSSRRRREQLCHDAMRVPDGWVASIAEPTRTLEQNAKLWPMLEDIQRQVPEMQGYTTEDIKLRFMDALGTEMRFLPKLEGQGMFPVGHKSSTLTVEQFSGLIELIYQFGARHGVRWSDEKAAA